MKYFITFLIFLISFILQTSLLRSMEIFGVIPNTTLILVVLYSLLFKEKQGILYGVMFGLLQDIFYGPIIGLTALLYFIIGFVVSEIKKTIYKDTVFSSLVLVSVSVVLFNLAYWMIVYFFGLHKSILYVLPKLAIEVVYDLCITFIVYKIFVKTYKQLKNKGFR